jgi:K+-transporting ATPase ATPase B chain
VTSGVSKQPTLVGPAPASAPVEDRTSRRRRRRGASLFAPGLVAGAVKRAFVMMRPDIQWKNPVMFVVEVGAVLILLYIVRAALAPTPGAVPIGYLIGLDAWLFPTVLFANFATAIAEARGKAQAEYLRRARHDTRAFRLAGEGVEEVSSSELKRGDRVLVSAGQLVPADGEIIEGVASLDESAITGESSPVIREAGGDRSGVTGGTCVLSDRIVVRVTAQPGESFLDRVIALVEGATRQRTPNELALTLVLTAFTLLFLIVVIPLWALAWNAERYMTSYLGGHVALKSLGTDVSTLVALLVCLIPTTIGGLLGAIGIAGMDRALAANVLAKSGKAIECAGDVDVVLLDKTGTITVGNRRATGFLPIEPLSVARVARLAALASLGDETPEGKSVVGAFTELGEGSLELPAGAKPVPFSAHTRMSGVDLPDGVKIRKGAEEAIEAFVLAQGGIIPAQLTSLVAKVASEGATPLVVSEGPAVAGVVVLEDVLKPKMRERFERLRRMGLRTVMITGDNPLTAATIAARAGVDDFLARATPDMKLEYLRQRQAEGKMVAMMGDGTNDAPALAQADVGLAMNAGTQAAREAANMVDLDSDPTKLIEVIEIGKQLLMTRGALTTFSIANDVAKYFAIVPALFAGTLPWLGALNVMHLRSATAAVLSAVLLNAIIIPALIPLALRGVAYRPIGADALLRRNLLVWGVGGVVVPFVGIKLINMLMVALQLAH